MASLLPQPALDPPSVQPAMEFASLCRVSLRIVSPILFPRAFPLVHARMGIVSRRVLLDALRTLVSRMVNANVISNPRALASRFAIFLRVYHFGTQECGGYNSIGSNLS